jgi:hypothetical protein
MRLLGLLATAALLGAGAYSLMQVMPDRNTASGALKSSPPDDPKPAAKHHAKKAPPKPKYTKAQRRQRAAAVAELSSQGYRPVHLGDYDARKVLRVMIGRGDAGQRAFFFNGAKYIGNDAAEDSQSIRVARAGNRSVALTYKLTTGHRARVLFRWDGKALTPQTSIPPVAERG